MRLDFRMQRIDPKSNSKARMTEPAMTPAKAPFDKCEWWVDIVLLDAMLEVLKVGTSFVGDQHLNVRQEEMSTLESKELEAPEKPGVEAFVGKFTDAIVTVLFGNKQA
jgi:hypothetical protein